MGTEGNVYHMQRVPHHQRPSNLGGEMQTQPELLKLHSFSVCICMHVYACAWVCYMCACWEGWCTYMWAKYTRRGYWMSWSIIFLPSFYELGCLIGPGARLGDLLTSAFHSSRATGSRARPGFSHGIWTQDPQACIASSFFPHCTVSSFPESCNK